MNSFFDKLGKPNGKSCMIFDEFTNKEVKDMIFHDFAASGANTVYWIKKKKNNTTETHIAFKKETAFFLIEKFCNEGAKVCVKINRVKLP